MSAVYDYVFLTLARAPTPHPALARRLAAAAPALQATGGEVVGQFAPQLGWAGDEAAVLVRWSGPRGDLGPVIALQGVTGARVEHVTPTIRPGDADRPLAGGVYVHRWFAVEAGAEDEFVQLSGEGWAHFEASFDTRIFGLFRAEPSDAARASGVTRLLLLTRYANHAVWEASRDPTTEAMQIFQRRQQLTRRSWAASTRLVGS
ncbi:MAG TPA: hypothetical protein VGG29_15970 [Caulobacteraceae bacterium]